jgi:hypothetical protein
VAGLLLILQQKYQACLKPYSSITGLKILNEEISLVD